MRFALRPRHTRAAQVCYHFVAAQGTPSNGRVGTELVNRRVFLVIGSPLIVSYSANMIIAQRRITSRATTSTLEADLPLERLHEDSVPHSQGAELVAPVKAGIVAMVKAATQGR